jgi:hypothetical protein
MRSQYYCSMCRTWYQQQRGTPVDECRRQHAARCLLGIDGAPDLIELDATLERIASLYLTGS